MANKVLWYLGGIELASPVFTAITDSPWRQDMKAMWRFIENNYHIEAPNTCATHIHVSVRPVFELEEVKRIAQAVIHFEPAIEALVPQHRRGNKFVQSHWLDSPNLAPKGRSRAASIAYIERQVDQNAVIAAMQFPSDGDYCWNFESLNDLDKGTIEFRKPPAVKTVDEVLAWAEFVMAFIQASIACEKPTQFMEFPPTAGGLKQFLTRLSGKVPGVSERERMWRLWRGVPGDSWLEPVPQFEEREWSAEDRKMRVTLERMIEEDVRWSKICGRSAREPVRRGR
jgi:Putative amidoligase enzyme